MVSQEHLLGSLSRSDTGVLKVIGVPLVQQSRFFVVSLVLVLPLKELLLPLKDLGSCFFLLLLVLCNVQKILSKSVSWGFSSNEMRQRLHLSVL
jgi:hypothetical protein